MPSIGGYDAGISVEIGPREVAVLTAAHSPWASPQTKMRAKCVQEACRAVAAWKKAHQHDVA